jgi:hypothetical protein
VQAVLQGDVGLLDLTGLEPDRTRDPVDGSQLVDDRALDPRDRVRLELDASFKVVLLDRVDEAEDAVGHQIGLLDVRRRADRHPADDVLDQRRVVEDEPLAGVGGRLELELLPQPFNGRRLAKKPPWPGATVEAVPAFGTRPTVPGRSAPRLASSAQARGCACS